MICLFYLNIYKHFKIQHLNYRDIRIPDSIQQKLKLTS